MKLFLPTAILFSVASASAKSIPAIRGETARALLEQSRRLEEDEEAEEEEEEEYSWMQSYQVKFVGCASGAKFQNQENGEVEYSSVVYRLCASNGECDSESSFGCTEGYDYVVGLNTYLEAYAESLKEDRRRKLEDEFELEKYAQCERVEVEEDEDGDGNGDDEVEYFAGPACSEDGSDILLQLYADEDCSYAADVSYYDVAGVELPYSSGGLASPYCQSCVEKDDDGNYETSEFCMQIGEASGGCDENDQSQCENIEALTADIRAAEAKSGKGWSVFFWILLIVIVLGVGWFFYKKQQEKKAAAGLDGKDTPLATMS